MTHTTPGIDRLAEANMRKWLQQDILDRKSQEAAKQTSLGPYLSISREFAAGGDQIATLVSKQLGWDLIDREILESIAKDFNVSQQLVNLVDERHVSWLTELFEAWIDGQSFSQSGYVDELSKLLMIAAQHGKFVMVGRGSQFILPRDHGVFVRLTAPLDYRIDQIVRVKDLTEKDARNLVVKSDRERKQFLNTFFGNDGCDPALYDITIDTSRFTTSQVATLIHQAIESRDFAGSV